MSDENISPDAIEQAELQIAMWDLMYPPFAGFVPLDGITCNADDCPCGGQDQAVAVVPISSSVN